MQRRPGAGPLGALAAVLALFVSATGTGNSSATGSGPELRAAAASAGQGYWLVGSDGAVFGFGTAKDHGGVPGALRRPIAGAAATPTGKGYWLVGSDGGIFAFGDAGFYGSTGHLSLNRPVVGMAATPTGAGYWFVAADGGIFAFGDAAFYGSTGAIHLNQPIVGMSPTPTGGGYWLVAADGGIFAFGDAGFYGSTGAIHLNKPIVDMAATATGRGYWLVASDGGIFAFGDAPFHGSTGDLGLNAPVVGMAPTPSGGGYWFVAADGGVFTYGDAIFAGSTGDRPGAPVVAMAAVTGGAPASDGSPSPSQAGPEPARPQPADPGAGPGTSDPAPAGPGTEPAPEPTSSTTTTTTGPAPAAVGPFDVALIGDTGYTSSQEEALLDIRDDVADRAVALTIHIGDIWAEGHSCDDEDYREVQAVFNGFAMPFLYTPGDNEWTDCSGSSSSALGRIRDIFFPTPESLGQRRVRVARHHEMPENARYTRGGVVFVTVNEPGAGGRGGSHRDRNVEWLEAAFDHAEAIAAAGVVVAWHDNPLEPSGSRLVKVFEERSMRFGKPVVFVHGDTHRHRIDHPWDDAPNITRVEVHGATSSGRWVRMTVDPAHPDVFSFDNETA